jgi:hypothetical protein
VYVGQCMDVRGRAWLHVGQCMAACGRAYAQYQHYVLVLTPGEQQDVDQLQFFRECVLS